jgi:plastocyanin domain-containing protein
MQRILMPRLAKTAGIVTVGLILGCLASGAIAVASHPETDHGHTTDRAMIPLHQPLVVRAGVTLVGAGLMAAELWWFLGQRDD